MGKMLRLFTLVNHLDITCIFLESSLATQIHTKCYKILLNATRKMKN